MKFYVYDVQEGKGYWRPSALGYTHNPDEAGLYSLEELPTHAGDCWIAIPQWQGHPNYSVVSIIKATWSWLE